MEIYYKKGMISVFGIDNKKWTNELNMSNNMSNEMKVALGTKSTEVVPSLGMTKSVPGTVAGFPNQL